MPFMERPLPVFSLEFALQIFLILGSTSGLIWILWHEHRASNRPFFWVGGRGGQTLEFLFENGVLIDCNAAAKGVLAQQGLSGTSWASISRLLRQQLGDLPITLGKTDQPFLQFPQRVVKGATYATLEQWGGHARLSVFRWPSDKRPKASVKLAVEDFRTLTNATLDAPFPMWRMSDEGEITWGNPAFFRHYAGLGDMQSQESVAPDLPESLSSGDMVRTEFPSPSGTMLPMDVTMIQQQDARMFFAQDASRIVAAEAEREAVVQVLTKTFAQLSAGIVIFDRDRRLMLFNPALVDQFQFSASFLAAKPTLSEFFDKLREARMIPEPRNYSNWREELTHLVVKAADDRYHEIWPLISGQTLQVTGRPHPGGGVAFLFEDITAELTLERKFRAQLDVTHAVIDRLNHAIAVVSKSGKFALTNAAFKALWGVVPDKTISDFTWRDFEDVWQFKVKETLILTMMGNFLRLVQDRNPWVREISCENGKTLKIAADPMPGGFTILTFEEIQLVERPASKTAETL